MKSWIFACPALLWSPRGLDQWSARRLGVVALLTLFTASAPAYGDVGAPEVRKKRESRGAYEGYEGYYSPPTEGYAVPAPAYQYDPVNRRSPFTPEPIWRSMFPSARDRARLEEATFGVPGGTANEMHFWLKIYEKVQARRYHGK